LRVVDAELEGDQTLCVLQAYFQGRGFHDLAVRHDDTRTIATLELDGLADLALVDAYHSAEGCYHECQLAWAAPKPGGLLVVDDVFDPGAPREGANRFCQEMGMLSPDYLPSLNGIYLAVKPL
jgi:predicted O-methyltransferase YrrM